MKQCCLALLGVFVFSVASAETLTLEQAIERALTHDPRIEERLHLKTSAKALVAQAEASDDWYLDGNAFIALTTTAEGNLYEGGSCTAQRCELRDDRYDYDGLSPWFYAKVGVIKPLFTFGKIENYTAAAKANVEVKAGDIRLQQGRTMLDVKRAYYGYLAARDSRLLFTDVSKRLQKMIDLVQDWLDDGEGDVKQADLYALQSGRALVNKYRLQATALERVAIDGLKVVTGVGLGQPLDVADRRLRPVDLPEGILTELQSQALAQRPEISQLDAGLRARRALLEAKKSEAMPNVYAALMGGVSYAPGRDRLSNPFIYDPFNEAGLTPVLGMKWTWAGSVVDAKAAGAEAELNALIAKSSLARQGIPYQVAEQYYQVQGHYEAVQELEQASRSARRWMIASYTDFEAGLEKADKIMTAFQGYVLATADYLKTTYDYNMHVARLDKAIGAKP